MNKDFPFRIYPTWGDRVHRRMKCHRLCGAPVIVYKWEIRRFISSIDDDEWMVCFLASCVDHVFPPEVMWAASSAISADPMRGRPASASAWMPFEDAVRTLRESYDDTVAVAAILDS